MINKCAISKQWNTTWQFKKKKKEATTKQTDHWFDCLGRGTIDFWNVGNVLYLSCI